VSSTDNFFAVQEEHSRIKAEMVAKYFLPWARILLKRHKKVGYIDLYSGPGLYEDGSKSTPVLVMEQILSDHNFSNKIATLFNDDNTEYIEALKRNLGSLTGYDDLANKPIYENKSVDGNTAAFFRKRNLIPCFVFIDPFGIKGLTIDLISGVLKNWGTDCAFFFNYSWVNRFINHPTASRHVITFYGPERTNRIRSEIEGKNSFERKHIFMNGLREVLRESGFSYYQHFEFIRDSRNSHFLILVSENAIAYKIMKGIMGGYGDRTTDGVPLFRYDSSPQLSLLHEPILHKLKARLLQQYAGKTIKCGNLWGHDYVDKPFLPKHYKDVLKELEIDGIISVSGRESNRGFADYLMVSFPSI